MENKVPKLSVSVFCILHQNIILAITRPSSILFKIFVCEVPDPPPKCPPHSQNAADGLAHTHTHTHKPYSSTYTYGHHAHTGTFTFMSTPAHMYTLQIKQTNTEKHSDRLLQISTQDHKAHSQHMGPVCTAYF